MLVLQRTAGNRAVADLLRPVQRAGPEEVVDDPPLPAGPFEGDEHHTVVHGQAFQFQGRTNASYAHNWRHRNDQVEGRTHTGELVENFTVTTRVSLPPMPEGLSECERPIVDDAINNRLNAHEQEHVAAFETYNGEEVTPYSITGSVGQVTAQLRQQHTTNETARRGEADRASRALDPFHIDVDTSSCDVEEE